MDKYLKRLRTFQQILNCNLRILDTRTMILYHRNERKNKSKVCFVQSSFGQKVWATFPIAQYRIASPYQNGAIVVYEKQIQILLF